MGPNPPRNSAAIAITANRAGMCIMPVKKAIVPLKPYPTEPPERRLGAVREKHSPSTNRRNVTAASLSVTVSLRIIKSFHSKLHCPIRGKLQIR
jgi:hypothetical protein